MDIKTLIMAASTVNTFILKQKTPSAKTQAFNILAIVIAVVISMLMSLHAKKDSNLEYKPGFEPKKDEDDSDASASKSDVDSEGPDSEMENNDLEETKKEN